MPWEKLPELILVKIYLKLKLSDLYQLAKTNKKFYQIFTKNKLLWKYAFYRDFGKPKKIIENPEDFHKSYKECIDLTPAVSMHLFDDCKDEVLHVSFSPNGQMLAICSKDAVFRVYDAEAPYGQIFQSNMAKNNQTHWEWCQAAHFSPNSQNVMVSGVFSRTQPYLGELAVYSIFAGTFTLESRIQIKPHDVFGSWFDNNHVISCKTQWHEGYPLISEVFLNKASQKIQDPSCNVVQTMFKFANKNWSVIRMINTVKVNEGKMKPGHYLVAAKGSRVWTPHELGFKRMTGFGAQSGDINAERGITPSASHL